MEKAITLRLQFPQREGSARSFAFRLGSILHSAPVQSLPPRKLFVLPAYAGDFATFRKLLRRARIINDKYRWTFSDGHLVVFGHRLTGQQPVSEYLWFMYSLDQQASMAGGRLHYIPGNGEFSSLSGSWRFHHPAYAASTTRKTAINAIYDGNNTLWQWLNSRNIIEKVGRILFIQGGILPSYGDVDLSLALINKRAREYYAGQLSAESHPEWYGIFSGNYNPLTYCGYWNGELNDNQIKTILRKYDVDLIITHLTTIPLESSSRHLINIPHNDQADGPLEGLIIRRKKIFTLGLEGVRNRLHRST